MKAALFILVSIIIFGIAIYVYLRKEQAKYIPKDKYDEAWDDVYKKRRAKGKNLAKLISTSLETGIRGQFFALNSSYIVILVPTFFAAALISFFTASIAAFGPFFVVALIMGLIGFPFLPFLFVIFPGGLTHIVYADSNNLLAADLNNLFAIVYGWLIYFVIILLSAFAKNRSAFNIIYFVFVILLILNIIGCTQQAALMF